MLVKVYIPKSCFDSKYSKEKVNPVISDSHGFIAVLV